MSGLASGVRRYQGIFPKWYGWASRGDAYREGALRDFRLLAWLDSRRLRRKLAKP